MEIRYVIVDLEATCWQKGGIRDRMEIIEIGAVLPGNSPRSGYGRVRPVCAACRRTSAQRFLQGPDINQPGRCGWRGYLPDSFSPSSSDGSGPSPSFSVRGVRTIWGRFVWIVHDTVYLCRTRSNDT